MSWELALDPLVSGALSSVRILMVLVAGPIFGHPALSPRIRIMCSLGVVWAVGPGLGQDLDWRTWSGLDFAGVLAVEATTGFLLGFSSNLIFAAFLVFGQFVSHQAGLSMAHEVDPLSGVSTTAVGTAFNAFGALVFLVIGGHHELLRAAVISFERLPIGGAGPDVEAFAAVATTASVIFEVGIRLAAPVTVAIFIENIAIGILGKAMPQLNLLMVNLPIHVGMLLLIVGLGAPDMAHAFKDVLEAWPERVLAIVLGAG